MHIMGKPRVSDKLTIFNKIKEINVVKCNNCGFYFTYPRLEMTDKMNKFLYDDKYFVQLTKLFKLLRVHERRRRFKSILKSIKTKPGRFLDVGCGEGHVLKDAIRRGWDAYGLDINDNIVIDRSKWNFDFQCQKLSEANYPENFFEAIYVDSVLEHVQEPRKFVMDIYRILKPGGIVMFAVPNENSLYKDVQSFVYKRIGLDIAIRIDPLRPPYHINGFSTDSLGLLLRNAGYELPSTEQISGIMNPIKFRISQKMFWIQLLMMPLYIIGYAVRKGVYIDAFAKKPVR